MDLKEIQTLIKFISSSGVDEVAIEKKDFKINIKKNLPPVISPSVVHAQPALAVAALTRRCRFISTCCRSRSSTS